MENSQIVTDSVNDTISHVWNAIDVMVRMIRERDVMQMDSMQMDQIEDQYYQQTVIPPSKKPTS